MSRRKVLVLALLVAFAPAALAEEAHFYFFPHYLASRIDSDARAGSNDGVDFERTLGVDPTEPTGELDGFARFRRYRLEFGLTRSEISGVATLKNDLSFGSNEYYTGERLFTDLEPERERLLVGYDFLEGKKLTLGPTIGWQRLYVETRIKFRCCVSADVTEFDFGVPVLGGSLGLHPFRDLAIHTRLSGTRLSGTRLLDGSVSIEYLIVGRVGIGAGYSHYHFNRSDRTRRRGYPPDEHVELIQRGWTAGIVVHL